MAWRADAIALDGMTVSQAVEEFNRYRHTPLVVGDPRIASVRVGGRFATHDSKGFIEGLSRAQIRAVSGQDRSVLLVAAK
jgi:transmembrane sensor